MKTEKTRMNIEVLYCLTPVLTPGLCHTLYTCYSRPIDTLCVTLLWVTVNTATPHVCLPHPAQASTLCTKLSPHRTALLPPQGLCWAEHPRAYTPLIPHRLHHGRHCFSPNPTAMCSRVGFLGGFLFVFWFCLFFVFFSGYVLQFVGPPPGIEPGPSAARLWNPNHWTAGEFSRVALKVESCLWKSLHK